MFESSKITRAAELMAQANSIVCLTGAGVSAESDVPTFRDAQTGYWSKYDPEELASASGFKRNPELVWRWYMERLQIVGEQAAPNPGHHALAQLEMLHDRFTLVTQNVDDLHEQAGSKNVVHLHGNLSRFRCMDCQKPYPLQNEDRVADSPPTCPICAGLIRPGVVWFGEMLPQREIQQAWQAAAGCDLALVIGTSGIVYPAAHLPEIALERGAAVIEINPTPTPISQHATLYLQGKSGDLLPQMMNALDELQN